MKRIEINSKVILTLPNTDPTEKELAMATITAEQYLNSIPPMQLNGNKVYFRFHFDMPSSHWREKEI